MAEIRQGGRTDRTEDRQKGKTDRTDIRQKGKTDRNEQNQETKWIWPVVVGGVVVAGLVILK